MNKHISRQKRKHLTFNPPDFFHALSVHCGQQPLSTVLVLTAGGTVPNLRSVHPVYAVLRSTKLALGHDDMETIVEAVSLGQVCCRLPAVVP